MGVRPIMTEGGKGLKDLNRTFSPSITGKRLFLKNILSPPEYSHTLSVILVMKETFLKNISMTNLMVDRDKDLEFLYSLSQIPTIGCKNIQ